MKEYRQSRFIGSLLRDFLGVVYLELTVVPTFFMVFLKNNSIIEFLFGIVSIVVVIIVFTSVSFTFTFLKEKRYRAYAGDAEYVKYDGNCIIWRDQIMSADSVKKIVLDIGNIKRFNSRESSLTLIDQSGKEMYIPYPPLMLILNIKKICMFAKLSIHHWYKLFLIYPAIFLGIGFAYAWGLQSAPIENV